MSTPPIHRDKSFLYPSSSASSSENEIPKNVPNEDGHVIGKSVVPNLSTALSFPMDSHLPTHHHQHRRNSHRSATAASISSTTAPKDATTDDDGPDYIEKLAQTVLACYRKTDKRILYGLAILLYHLFWAYAIYQTWSKTEGYCGGVKLLTILTIIAYIVGGYKFAIAGRLGFVGTLWHDKLAQRHKNVLGYLGWVTFWLLVIGYFASFAWNEVYRLQSTLGYVLFLFLGFIFSKHRHAIRWSQIGWGLAMQITFGIVVLRTQIGRQVFKCLGEKVNTLLDCTLSGSRLIFGYLADGMLKGPGGNVTVLVNGTEYIVEMPKAGLEMSSQDAIFAFTSMPVVIFFSFFVSILYYYGVMQIVVRQLGWLLQVTIGTTACESISASGNIFLGMTESPLLVRPFLPLMTKSELHAVLTGGFATIAGSVMAAYINFGISAEHLISASVMAAPSALALSKLLYPETEVSRTSTKDIVMESNGERNAIEAGSNGASAAVKLVSNIVANLIAFMAFLTFLDQILGWVGGMIDLESPLSFELILSKLFIPFALMLGIDWADCDKAASLIGLKMVVNEFVAYKKLGDYKLVGLMSLRSQTIITYALCGFANFGSIGIQVGGLSAMAPGRKAEIAELAFRSMLTGTMASFLTACLAGMLV